MRNPAPYPETCYGTVNLKKPRGIELNELQPPASFTAVVMCWSGSQSVKAAQRGLSGLLLFRIVTCGDCLGRAASFHSSDVTTFREKYCAARGCSSEAFATQLFWRCLHPHAVAVAPVVAAIQRGHFDADRELIAAAARARTMGELDEEILDFMHDARNRHWWRRRGRLRLSTQRLRRIARVHLLAGPAERR